MNRYLIAYSACLLILLILDATWLSWATDALYKPQIGNLLAMQPRWGAAAVFYLLYAMGVAGLIVVPSLKDGSATVALIYGAIFGVVAYGTYDLTNLATLQDWPLRLTMIDMAWGAVLTAAASSGSFIAAAHWSR